MRFFLTTVRRRLVLTLGLLVLLGLALGAVFVALGLPYWSLYVVAVVWGTTHTLLTRPGGPRRRAPRP